MAQFTAVSQERHAGKRWLRSAGYWFAVTQATVPVVGAELARAALSMPLAFTEQGGRYTLVAVLSLAPGRNMFVAPDGRWLGGYVPAAFRGYPFGLAPKPGTAEIMLCVDEGSVTDVQAGGEPFFDGEGKLSPALQSIFDFLSQLESSRRATDAIVSALAAAGVIQPWPITVKIEQGGDQAISGFHRIDEAALNALPDATFLKLRKASALPIAYAQLLSTRQIGIFPHLAKLQAQLTAPPVAALPETLDSLLETLGDDIVRFK